MIRKFYSFRPRRTYGLPPAPDDKAVLGAHAKRLLEDPVLMLAFERIERDLTLNWRKTQLGQTEQREEAYRLIWALEAVRSKLRAFAGDAKVIAAEQARKDAEEKRAAERRERAAGLA